MTAYVIFTRELMRDQVEFDRYTELAVPTLADHPGIARAFYGKLDILEGSDIEGAVVLEFPTMADARAWYDSPAYQTALKHRKIASDYRVFIVEGVPAVS